MSQDGNGSGPHRAGGRSAGTATMTPPPVHPVAAPASVPPRVGPTRARRRPALVALGVVLAVLGALTAVVLVGSAGQRTAVLALARDVPFGAVVTDADLTRVQVSVDPGVATVPAADLSQVVGQVAASDLHTGQLLTPDALTSAAPPAAGQVLVGIALPAERMPAGSLQPGDEVLVVDTPAAGADPPTDPARVDPGHGGAGRRRGCQRGQRGRRDRGRGGRAGAGRAGGDRADRGRAAAAGGVQMTAVGLCSAKGSPGVTTTALALAQVWPGAHPGRRVLLVDADPAGGDIAPGYLRGEVDPGRGVVGLAAGRDPDPLAALSGQLLALDETGERLLLLGVPDARRAAAVAGAWPRVAAALPGLAAGEPPTDVLVDLGRLGPVHDVHDGAGDVGVLRRGLDLLVLVTGSSLRAVVAGRAAATQLS